MNGGVMYRQLNDNGNGNYCPADGILNNITFNTKCISPITLTLTELACEDDICIKRRLGGDYNGGRTPEPKVVIEEIPVDLDIDLDNIPTLVCTDVPFEIDIDACRDPADLKICLDGETLCGPEDPLRPDLELCTDPFLAVPGDNTGLVTLQISNPECCGYEQQTEVTVVDYDIDYRFILPSEVCFHPQDEEATIIRYDIIGPYPELVTMIIQVQSADGIVFEEAIFCDPALTPCEEIGQINLDDFVDDNFEGFESGTAYITFAWDSPCNTENTRKEETLMVNVLDCSCCQDLTYFDILECDLCAGQIPTFTEEITCSSGLMNARCIKNNAIVSDILCEFGDLDCMKPTCDCVGGFMYYTVSCCDEYKHLSPVHVAGELFIYLSLF
eukprot:TRINITY_DN4532_c0_g1_i2.p1 TRINITY_DN4532_c0_g1~~TRINITY_DN4532_c0_g1_i2.p1  ORF type:complete len:386 (-),score=123.68 TRINITY_DN4532_c0_g1_i2:24-1181(-)